MFADKEQEKLKRAFELVESVASNYESGNNLSGKSFWNKNPKKGGKFGMRGIKGKKQ